MLDRRRFLTLAAAFAAPLGAAEEGFEPLFDGASLAGWDGDESIWRVEDGCIVGRSPGIRKNVFLATAQRYQDFVLRLEVRLLRDIGNSGVQFRSERDPNSTEMIGYQADIGPGWWGNLYDESRRRKNLAEADPKLIEQVVRKDDWNDYEVRAEGGSIRLTLNGRTTVEYKEPDAAMARSGRIAVQVHAGPPLEVRFRNVRLRKL
ncbi:MAG: DUF1080 domain-containing protein [Acidobacteria bacterium]|nr:DUF1080 domain-containing protein [Acidobacteriota bacterium]